jgi:hypothetical protein
LAYALIKWEASLAEFVEQQFLQNEVLILNPTWGNSISLEKNEIFVVLIKLLQLVEKEVYLICMENVRIVKGTILLYANVNCS